MSTLQSKLIVSLVDQVTAPARRAAESIRGIARAANILPSGGLLGGARDAINQMKEANRATMASIRAPMVEAIAVGVAMQRALSAPITAASQFESVMLDIRQKADLSSDAVKLLGERIRSIAPAFNQTAHDVAKGIDFLAGMGLDPVQATTLIEPIGKAAAAYAAEVQDLARAGFAVLDNLKLKPEEFARALDVMVQSGKAGGFELKDMAKQFSSLTAGAQALGQTGVQAVGRLSAALQIALKGAGDGSEAATNVKNLLQKIVSPETTRRFKKFGIDIRAELKKVREAGGDPFEMIAELVNKALKGDLSKLGDLFEDMQVGSFLRPLIANLTTYRKIRDDAIAATGVVDQDFKDRLLTTEAQFAAFRVRMQDLSLTLGEILLPAVNSILAASRPIIATVKGFTEANKALVGGAIKLTGGLIGIRVAAIGTRYAVAFMKGALLTAVAPAIMLAQGMAGLAKALIVVPVLAAATAAFRGLRMAMIGFAASGAIAGLPAALRLSAVAMVGLLNPIKLVRVAMLAAAASVRLFKVALLGTGIGALMVGIGAAATFIHNNWEGLGRFFRTFFDTLRDSLKTIDAGRFKYLVEGLDQIAKLWRSATGEIDAEKWEAWGKGAGRSVAESIRAIADALDGVVQKINAIRDAWNSVTSFFNNPFGSAAPVGFPTRGPRPSSHLERGEADPSRPKSGAVDRATEPVKRNYSFGWTSHGEKSAAATAERPKSSPLIFPAEPMESKEPIFRSPETGRARPGAWLKEASPVRFLDQSGPAGVAGTKTGDAFAKNFQAALGGVDDLIDQSIARWTSKLGGFRASPTITPNISAPPNSGGGTPGRQSSADGVSRALGRRVAAAMSSSFMDHDYA